MPINLATLKRPTFILKLVELLLAIICIALVSESLLDIGGKRATIYGTFIGFLILSCVMIAAAFMETTPHPWVMVVVSAVGGIMFIVSGALCIDLYSDLESWPNTTNILISGIIGFIAAVAYAADAFFTYKYNAS